MFKSQSVSSQNHRMYPEMYPVVCLYCFLITTLQCQQKTKVTIYIFFLLTKTCESLLYAVLTQISGIPVFLSLIFTKQKRVACSHLSTKQIFQLHPHFINRKLSCLIFLYPATLDFLGFVLEIWHFQRYFFKQNSFHCILQHTETPTKEIGSKIYVCIHGFILVYLLLY